MADIWTMGEMLAEIMRPKAGMSLSEAGEFIGPFPSGAPAIFIDTVARLGHSAGIIGGVGQDDFGLSLLNRLRTDGVDLHCVKTIGKRATAVAFVTYAEDGSRHFIFHIDGTPPVMARFVCDAAIGQPLSFHVMGCSLMPNDAFRAEIFKAVEWFHERGYRISFDPNFRSELLGRRYLMELIAPVLERNSILFRGEAELKLIGRDRTPLMAIERLFENPALELIVLKQGGVRRYTLEGH